MLTFSKQKLHLQKLIDRYGEQKVRAYFQLRFSKPEHYFEFESLFQNHLSNVLPHFHEEMIAVVMEGLFLDKGKGTRFGFGAPRGFAKSTQFDLFFLAWCIVNGFYHFVLLISDTHSQAKLLISALKSEIESNEILAFIYPNLIGRIWGEEQIIVNSLQGEVMVLPLGAGMKVRGIKFKQYRPQLAIIDDLENLEAVYSPERRFKLKRWFDEEFEPAFDRYNKNIIYIGTKLHYNALLSQVLDRKEKYQSWVTITFKALQDDGTSLWENRFSADYLRSIRDDPTHPDYVGSIVFSQEYQNEPQDDQDRIIKLDWVKEYNFRLAYLNWAGESEEEKRRKFLLENFEERVGAVDVAISEKTTGDFFAMYTFGLERKTMSEKMLDLIHGKYGNINEQVTLIADAVADWHITTLGIESVAFQKGLANLVRVELQRRGIYISVVEIKTDKDKIRRARIHSSAFEGGFIYLRTDHKNYNIIKRELEEFPLGEHDDAFDALMLSREARQRPSVRTFANKPSGL